MIVTYITILLGFNFFLTTTVSTDLVCAGANDKEKNYEIVNCKFRSPSTNVTINFKCEIFLNKELDKIDDQNVIEADFRIKDQILKQEQANFFWKSTLEHSHSHSRSNSSEFKNQTVKFTKTNDLNISKASLVLYKINYERLYEICVNVPNLFDEKVCCSVENKEEEEESNIYMVLVVLGVLLLIYAFVVIATWRMSKKEETVEQLLEELPTSQIERLKSIFIAEDDDDDLLDEEVEDEPEVDIRPLPSSEHFVKNKPGKSAKKVTIRDNHAYEPDDDEEKTKKLTEEEMDDLQFNLYREAQKLRKASRMSVAALPNEDLRRLKEKNTEKSVKFNNNDDIMPIAEIDRIKLKVYNESKRRASIKPFKKAYDLDVSDSE